MFNDTIRWADLSEENKGAAEQEDLPCFSKSINHSEKRGWLAVQMRRPLRGGPTDCGPSARLLCWCSTWNLAVNVHRNRMRGCCGASADGAEAVRVSASRRWRMKKKANGGSGRWWLASKLLVLCTGARSETFDWRGRVMSFKASGSNRVFYLLSSSKNEVVMKQTSVPCRRDVLISLWEMESKWIQTRGHHVSRYAAYLMSSIRRSVSSRPLTLTWPYSEKSKKKTPYYHNLSNFHKISVIFSPFEVEHVWQTRTDCHPTWSHYRRMTSEAVPAFLFTQRTTCVAQTPQLHTRVWALLSTISLTSIWHPERTKISWSNITCSRTQVCQISALSLRINTTSVPLASVPPAEHWKSFKRKRDKTL